MWAKRPTGTSQLSGGGGLIADRRGVSVVEFALVAPMLLLLYLGGFELLQGIAIKRMVALTASTVANIVSQFQTISRSGQLPGILGASAQVMAPYPSARTRGGDMHRHRRRRQSDNILEPVAPHGIWKNSRSTDNTARRAQYAQYEYHPG